MCSRSTSSATARAFRSSSCRNIRTGGHVAHEYADHASIIKFIERNWGLSTLSKRSRDNLPNPKDRQNNPYVPTNGPAIGDLWSMFDFGDR